MRSRLRHLAPPSSSYIIAILELKIPVLALTLLKITDCCWVRTIPNVFHSLGVASFPPCKISSARPGEQGKSSVFVGIPSYPRLAQDFS